MSSTRQRRYTPRQTRKKKKPSESSFTYRGAHYTCVSAAAVDHQITMHEVRVEITRQANEWEKNQHD